VVLWNYYRLERYAAIPPALPTPVVSPGPGRYTIWPSSGHPMDLKTVLGDDTWQSICLYGGRRIMRRFRAPAEGDSLRGAFYLSHWYDDPALPEVAVSVYADDNGHPDTRAGRLGATRLEPGKGDHGSRHGGSYSIYRVPFALACRLQQGHNYWLTLAPTWPPEPPHADTTIHACFLGPAASDAETVVLEPIGKDARPLPIISDVGLTAELELQQRAAPQAVPR
jgi:hypothetical protein